MHWLQNFKRHRPSIALHRFITTNLMNGVNQNAPFQCKKSLRFLKQSSIFRKTRPFRFAAKKWSGLAKRSSLALKMWLTFSVVARPTLVLADRQMLIANAHRHKKVSSRSRLVDFQTIIITDSMNNGNLQKGAQARRLT